jgi:hypothetical protein
MNPPNGLAAITQKLKYPGNLVLDFLKLVTNTDQSYFSKPERKSRWRIWRENVLWIAKHREINRFYYVYWLDKKGNDCHHEKIGYRRFRRMRDTYNLKLRGVNFNYACLLHDKFVFGQFASSLQFPVPKNIALFENGQVNWLDTMKTDSLENLAADVTMNIDGFCKQLAGLQGQGAFPLRIEAGKIYSGDKEITVAELKKKMNGRYLWQHRVYQHPAMGRLHPDSVNTLRIVTFNVNGRIEVFCGVLRMGVNGKSVDNWGAGGISIPIDMETGRVKEEGFFKPRYGGRVKVHPNSGVTFLNYEIPFFKESLELIRQFHRHLYGIHSIGWDIAITPAGPIFIEANEDWDGSFAMSVEKDFKARFLKMYQ